jgi:hypothetical protein
MLLGIGKLSVAQTMPQRAFEADLYCKSEISHYGRNKAMYEVLTPGSKKAMVNGTAPHRGPLFFSA